MKRTSRLNLKLTKRLQLVRMTVRELASQELQQANGADTTATGLACLSDCCLNYSKP